MHVRSPARRGLWLVFVGLFAACGGGTAQPSVAPSSSVTAAMAAAGGGALAPAPTASAVVAGQSAAPGAVVPSVAGMAGRSAASTPAQPLPAAGVGAVDPANAPAPAGAMASAPAAGSGSPAAAPAPPAGPLFPANGAKDVCADVSLHLYFESEPSLGSSGKISVFSSQSGSAVAVVDLASMQVRETVGGVALQLPRPVLVNEREIVVRLPKRLDYGQEYYVTVDAGVIKSAGAAMTFTDKNAWRFTTRSGPPSNLSQLRVALDGSGDFCSVQGALDAAPARAAKTEIEVGPGTYFEAVHVSGKSNITLRGADRKRTLIVGTNNENLNSGTAKRALVSIESSQNILIEQLTIRNLTPQGGSQAEALRLDKCEQCVVRHADILSLQDTLLWTGHIFASDCYIEGNVDFVWGYGAAYFERCEIKTVGRAGYVVQARNMPGDSGYVFVDSKITAGPGVSKIMLGRIDASAFAGSQVAYVNCQMGDHIAPEGWTVTGGGGSGLRFWEYQSTNASGAPLDVSRRHPASKQITADQAQKLRDPAQVLGGWNPPR